MELNHQKMSKKITYLFGAGSSANCLPIVKDIPGRLWGFRNFLLNNRLNLEDNLFGGMKQKDVEEEIIIRSTEIVELLNNKHHASIDTYAKRLRINAPFSNNAREAYNGLKAILSCFFIYEQMQNKVDYRYDSFFASMLSDSHTEFPENVRILTWNYDFQFEKAYSLYSGENSLSGNQSLLRVFQSGNLPRDTNGFGVYKLNGTTSFIIKKPFEPELRNLHDSLDSFDIKELIQEFTVLYNNATKNSEKIHPTLSFAWESDWSERTRKFLEKTEEAVDETEILVVIGYSFPFFNRKTDRRMINTMERTLKKVYIQDKYPNTVIDSFKSIITDYVVRSNAIDIEPISSYEQFFLPPEL
jgi:hypothetical protein